MSDMSPDAEARRIPSLASIWWKPRHTIERIVAGGSDHFILPLASLGGAAAAADMLMNYGVGSDLVGWRVLLACLVGGGALGIINLYLFAAVTGWFGRRMGGQASPAAVRSVFAWGTLPNILGLAIVLSVAYGTRVLVGNTSTEPRSLSSWLSIVAAVFSLWSIVVTLLMLSRVERFAFWRTIAAYLTGALLMPAVLALIVRSFLFQPFSLPAASMIPTLLAGDYVFAAKYSYGYSRYSLPFSPLPFSGRVFGSEPARGDVIVFRLPKDLSTDYVKRVVGLPGDRIQTKEGELYINGKLVQREPLPDLLGSDACGGRSPSVKRWRETLPDGASYETLDCVNNGYYDNTSIYTVPAGSLFVLGDNRDNSTDSRVLTAVGYVPIENVIGRVTMIFFSRAAGGNSAQASIRYERIGIMVR